MLRYISCVLVSMFCVLSASVAGAAAGSQMELLQGLGGRDALTVLSGKKGSSNSPDYDAMMYEQVDARLRMMPLDPVPSAIEISIQSRVNSLLGISSDYVRENQSGPSMRGEVEHGVETISDLKVKEQRRQELLAQKKKAENFGKDSNAMGSATMPPIQLSGVDAVSRQADAALQKIRQDEQLVDDSVVLRAHGSDMKQYGYELFTGVPSTFLPATDIPVPPEYVLGPGDEINLQFYGSRDDSLSLVVDREGVIEIPQAGQMMVSGMVFSDVKALIAENVRQKMIGTTVSVAMGRLRSIRVFVLGDVNYPGSYVVSGLSTISHALYAAGGIAKKGSLRHVQLKRAGKVIRELDLYDFLLKGNNFGDARLLPGDVVFVPPVGKVVGVAGQVVRPGIYEINQEKSLADMVLIAGGSLPDADVAHMQVERISAAGHRGLVDVDLKGRAQRMPANNGDILMLHSVAGLWANKVSVSGQVNRPGSYGLRAGMKISDLITVAGGLTERAYAKTAEITRFNIEGGDTREAVHYTVDLADVLSGDVKADLELQAYDELQVKSISQWAPSAHVTLRGEVKFPGVYAIEDGERLASVIKRAGGFSDAVYLPAAVFTRESIRLEQVKRTDEMVRRIEADIAKGRTQLQSIHDAKLIIDKENALNGAEQMLGQLKNLEPQGRLIVELAPLDDLVKGPFNIKLKDGDNLYLPSKPDQVLVMGEVYNQTAMVFQNQLERGDYIQRAGGVTATADEDRIYVVRASGYVESASGWGKSNKVYPGDVIVVPQSLDQFNLLDSMLDWSKVVMQLSTSAATLRVLGVI